MLIRKIEVFLRGELWLHAATMFVAATFLAHIFNLSFITLCAISTAIAVIWEFAWYKIRHNKINAYDIISTIAGGVVAALIHKLL